MHKDAHCNTYCKEKLEKPEHLHMYVPTVS